MADWSTTLDSLDGLSEEEKGKARFILSTQPEKHARLIVSGPPGVAAATIKTMLRRDEEARAVAAAVTSRVANTSGGEPIDPTTAYLRACLSPPFPGTTLLGRDVEVLRRCLRCPIRPGLPLPLEAARRLQASHPWLRDTLAPCDTQAETAPSSLSWHLQSVLMEDVTGPVVGCSSKMYAAFTSHRLLERTWWLLAKHTKVVWLTMDRNVVDPTEATVGQLRPDFLCWVNGALLLKGEEKATDAGLKDAVAELQDKMSRAWVDGTVQQRQGGADDVPSPCMLAYAAAGSKLQFIALVPEQATTAGGGVRAEPISQVLDTRQFEDRLTAVIAAFNIWRLLVGYAAMDAPAPALPVGQTLKFDGSKVTMLPGLPGFVRKVIPNFKDSHEEYTTFQVLHDLYGAISKPLHRSAVVQAVDGTPRMQADGSYLVHLTPPGVPCVEPPGSEDELRGVVACVLRGLAALHAEGFVHRDVRWRNIIYLPAEGRWLLIDLEHAGRVDCDCRRPPFPLQHWSDRILEGDGTYSPASDLRMVAEQLMASQEDGDGRAGALLVRRPPFTLSAAGQDLRRQLLQADSSSREQLAAALLAHPWLQSPAGAGAAGGAGGSAGSPS
ncbi:hypothetical protein CHLRE_05g244550v5 [Chlamydomonas reinhardtii]|uniref:Protein kinase domain-containing protein n=1 Tax=Chlamydomonas reinhardtii TaxID=3055 RepID=A0A2K3DS91_CHLRE|nr:uncharacterized protein CHLRE_05g244550v5 [Chlamydomonas reinhardtii]PNW83402.1 hypothetical protein CHLRE_05g244550v5 [Chlamydomonas reinhardtii]